MSTFTKILSCPACEKGSYLFKYVGNFRLNRCPSCGVIHLDKVSVSDEKPLFWGDPEYFRKYKTVCDYYFEDRFEKIMKGNPKREDWLDIGAGFGLWMEFLRREKRIQSSGIDIDEKAIHYAHSKNLEIDHQDFFQFNPPKKFQVITLCDVLDYLENPLEALNKCFDLLDDGGLLYIEVPNVLGFKYPFNQDLGLPHKLWQFDPKSLHNLINRANLSMVDYWTGVQGVVSHYERGTATFTRKVMWKLASELKRGNRLQMLVQKRV